MITELDNEYFTNMKNLSSIKYNKKIIDKMRNKKTSNEKLKKIFSDSNLNPISKSKEINNKKLRIKSQSSLREKIIYSDKKDMNNTTSMISKKLIVKNIIKNFYKKGFNKDDASSSLSTLIKTNTSFFNTSHFNFNTEKKKLTMNNFKTSIKNNRNKDNFEQQNFFTISFNKCINEYLQKNYLNKNFSSTKKFLEAIRIIRKEKIINKKINKDVIETKENETVEINNYEQLEFFIKNNQKYFLIYFEGLKFYIRELLNIKRREKDYLAELKFEIENLKRIITKKNMSIKTVKEKLNNLKEIKNFLIQVKFGKSLEQLSNEIKKEYGFLTPEKKERDKRKTEIIQKNVMSAEPLKRKVFSLNSKNKDNKRPSIKEKRLQIINKPLFENTEQFMSCFNFKTEKIKENLTLYWKNLSLTNKFREDYKNICFDNESYNKLYIPEEEKLLKALKYNKKRNKILNENLNNLIEINTTKQNYLINIAMKLKKILLNIESQLDIRKCIKEKNLEKFLRYQSDIFKNKQETLKYTKYMIKLIELVALGLIINRNKIKNNEKMKDMYKKVYAKIEQENIFNRYQHQLSLQAKKKEEINKKFFNKITKIQVLSSLKNGKKCVKEQIPDKILLKRKLEIKKAKQFLNKYEKERGLFSFS